MNIECFVCDKFQLPKASGHFHCLLPDRDIAGAPWKEVAVDLIGQWPASTPHASVEFFALTCIDTPINLVKIAQIFMKSSDHVATHFEHTWLSKYLWPIQVIHGNGGEFTGFAFEQLFCLLNIKPFLTKNKNPQANYVCKQMHQTAMTVSKTLLVAQPP